MTFSERGATGQKRGAQRTSDAPALTIHERLNHSLDIAAEALHYCSVSSGRRL